MSFFEFWTEFHGRPEDVELSNVRSSLEKRTWEVSSPKILTNNSCLQFKWYYYNLQNHKKINRTKLHTNRLIGSPQRPRVTVRWTVVNQNQFISQRGGKKNVYLRDRRYMLEQQMRSSQGQMEVEIEFNKFYSKL